MIRRLSIVVGLALEPTLIGTADRTAFGRRLGCDCEPTTAAHPLDRLNVVKLSAVFEAFEQFEITLFVHDLDLGYEFI